MPLQASDRASDEMAKIRKVKIAYSFKQFELIN